MKKNNFKNSDESKLHEEAAKHKYKCKCGHSVVIYPFEHKEKKVCSWCGYNVYISKKAEFKDRLKQRLKGA